MCFYYPEQHLGTTKVATIDWLKDEELASMVDADFPPENEPNQEFSSQTPLGGGNLHPLNTFPWSKGHFETFPGSYGHFFWQM